jgi:hypothetical protein
MIAPLYPIYGDCIRVTPDFQEKVFFGSLSLKGRLYGCLLVYIALSLLIDKNIQYIIRKIRKKEV